MFVSLISLTTIVSICIYNKCEKHKNKKKMKCPPKYFDSIQEYVEFIMKNKLTTEEYGTFLPFDISKFASFEEARNYYKKLNSI